jgi:type II secretion system protein D
MVAALAVFTVSRALSQPAAQPAKSSNLEARPLPSTDVADDSTFAAYVAPDDDIEAAARQLRTRFDRVPGFRVAADPRTGRLLVMAPPAVHKQLAATLKPAPDAAAATDAKQTAPRTQKSLTLKNTKAADFEAALASLAGRQLPVSVDGEGNVATYTLTSRTGQHVAMRIHRQSGQVSLDGPGDLVNGWVRVAMTLDSPQQSDTEQSRVVPVHNTTPASRGAIQRALALIGKQTGEATVDTAGHMVSMRLQPREGAAGADGDGANGQVNAQLVQQPGGAQVLPQPPGVAAIEGEGGLIGPVQIEFLEGLDQIVIKGHPRDVERVIEIIRLIEKEAAITAPTIEIVFLQNVTGQAMADLINTIYEQVFLPRYGRISITPLIRPNALLLIGRTEAIKAVTDLVKQLDVPTPLEAQFQVFPLRHAAAADVETTIREYLSGGAAPGQVGAQQQQPLGLATRGVVIADYRTNSLIVQASRRDLDEIDALIKQLDKPTSAKVNQLRVFTLRNALAEELAPVLQSAITGQQIRTQQGQQGGGGFQQFQQFQQQQQQQQQGGQRAGQNQPSSTMLQFLTVDAQGRRLLQSGILTDVRITADASTNALLVSAPPDSMDLIAALIDQLDTAPTSTAQIKVFKIERGDAQSLMNMLQQLFGLQQTGVGGAGGQQQQLLQQFITAGGEGSPLVSLRFSVDTRTNSIIASGSAGDLTVVEAILLRLDEDDVRQRRSAVVRLKNAPANLVADAINQFLLSRRQVEQQFGAAAGLVSPFEQIEREVVVVPEMVTNSLIISATQRFFDEIRGIVEQIDARPPMVAIQVLIAEVTLSNTDEFGVELGLQDSILFDRSILGDIQTITRTTTFGDPPTTVSEDIVVTATNTPGFIFGNPTIPLGNSGSASALANSNVIGTQGLSNFAVGRINNELGFGGLVLSASSESLSFLLRALSESRRLDVLARPQVTTLENQTAIVQVGQRVPYITASQPILGGGVQNTLNFQDVGLILLVTPRVTADGMVVMDIHAERSEVGPIAEGIPVSIGPTGDAVLSPRINTTIAETTVNALNGQTLVLGGLITKVKSETHRRVPLLADIPVLGHLFRYDNVQNRRTELLIIMTPRILRTKEDADILKQVESARMSWCLADVIKIHGESGLRGRNAEWTDAETTVVYPDFAPEMLEGTLPGSAEEILGPAAKGTSPLAPPTSPPPSAIPPGTPRLAPPTSAPPVIPGTSSLRIPLEPRGADPPPSLPAGASAKPPRPAGPAVQGPTLAPQQTGTALPPRQNNTNSAVHNAGYTEPVRGSFYANPPATDGPQQAVFRPPQGMNQQAIHELPVR